METVRSPLHSAAAAKLQAEVVARIKQLEAELESERQFLAQLDLRYGPCEIATERDSGKLSTPPPRFALRSSCAQDMEQLFRKHLGLRFPAKVIAVEIHRPEKTVRACLVTDSNKYGWRKEKTPDGGMGYGIW